MSNDAYMLTMMQRALARSDAALFGNRHLYLARARVLAERIFSDGFNHE